LEMKNFQKLGNNPKARKRKAEHKKIGPHCSGKDSEGGVAARRHGGGDSASDWWTRTSSSNSSRSKSTLPESDFFPAVL